MDAPEIAKFGWRYPAGAAAGPPDDGPSDDTDNADDSDACYPYECRRGRPCYQHHDG